MRGKIMKIKVCLAQIKPTLGNVKKNLEIMCSNIEKAIEEENNVMVFPNMPVACNNVGESVSLYCPNCKNPIGQNDIFCKTCGYNLKSTNQDCAL